MPQAPSDLLVQLCHRLAAIATLVLTTVIIMSATDRESVSMQWTAVFATDATVLLICIALVTAYRGAQSLRELLILLFFSLLLAHLAVWCLVRPGQFVDIAGTFLQQSWTWLIAKIAPAAP